MLPEPMRTHRRVPRPSNRSLAREGQFGRFGRFGLLVGKRPISAGRDTAAPGARHAVTGSSTRAAVARVGVDQGQFPPEWFRGAWHGNRPTGLGQQAASRGLRRAGFWRGGVIAEYACRPKRLGLPVRQQVREIRTRRAHRTPCHNPRRAPSRTLRAARKPEEGRPGWHLTAGAGPVPGGIPVSVSRRLQDIRTGAVHVGWHGPRHNYFRRIRLSFAPVA